MKCCLHSTPSMSANSALLSAGSEFSTLGCVLCCDYCQSTNILSTAGAMLLKCSICPLFCKHQWHKTCHAPKFAPLLMLPSIIIYVLVNVDNFITSRNVFFSTRDRVFDILKITHTFAITIWNFFHLLRDFVVYIKSNLLLS